MKRATFAVGIAMLACAGAPVRAHAITATTALAIAHWSDAVMHHTPGEVDAAVTSVEALTMDDRRELNEGMALFLAAITKKGVSTSAIASRRIADLGLDLSRNPGATEFLERAAVLHGDAAMFGFKGVVVLPGPADAEPAAAGVGIAPNRNMTPRNAPLPGRAEVPPLLYDGYLPVENDGEVVGRISADWNWVFARSLLDLIAPKHADDAFIGSWYHATTSFLYWRRLFGEASKHLDRAAVLLPDDARVIFDRACYAEMQGLPRSQQVLSDEDLLAMRLAGQRGQQASRGLVRAGFPAQSLGVRPMEVTNAEAERLFRRALELDPRMFEARVRLARLLTLRSQYAEALAILRAAPAGTTPSEGMLAFYADLFSTRAERALGRLDAAAEDARQALQLFPDAQSALMASSQIAMLRADAAGAEEPLRHLATLTPESDQRDDPWWVYDIFSGRDAKIILRGMWTQALAAHAPHVLPSGASPTTTVSPDATHAPATAVDPTTSLLEAARRALAGTAASPIRSFSIKGNKRILGEGERSVPFEISCELPDRFVWREDAGLQGVVIRGFNGAKLITDTPESVALARPGSTGLTIARDRDQLVVARADFAFWTLGLFASSFDGYPLQFGGAVATSDSNAISVRSVDGVLGLTMAFHPTTHLPDRLRYRVDATAGAAAIDKEVVYADYRDVGGRRVPFRVVFTPVATPAARPMTSEEYVVTDFKLNSPIDPKVFR